MNASTQRDLQEGLWRSHGGFDLVMAPVIFALLGLWIDGLIGTRPLFTISLLIFGAVGAALKVYFDWKRNMAAADAAAARLRAEAGVLRRRIRTEESDPAVTEDAR